MNRDLWDIKMMINKTGNPKIRRLFFGSSSLWVLVCLCILFTGCESGPALESNDSGARPNILLIVSEDNGPDLGCYGLEDVHTPYLDGLAADGIMYNNAFVTYSVCSPSRSTIYTGLYPHQSGHIGLATHRYRMYESYPTMPKMLKEAGYRTGCLGKIHVNPESAIPWDFHQIKGSNFAKKGLDRYAKLGGQFMKAGDDPFFLMVNFPDAHCGWQPQVEGRPANPMTGDDLDHSIPFTGIDNKRHRQLTADYYNSMNRLDESVGMLLDTLAQSGKAENTIIIYLGDHGAQFSRGKCSNYEAALRVPFIVKWPGKVKGNQVSDQLISTIDLLPTVLSVVGLPVPDHLPGKSLLPSFMSESGSSDHHKFIFAGGAGSASFFTYPRRSVRDKRFKLINNLMHERENPKYLIYAYTMYGTGTLPEEVAAAPPHIQKVYETWSNPPEFELYDLDADPLEFKNLSDDPAYVQELNRLKNVLHVWQEETYDPLADPEILNRFIQEMDSINEAYPNRDYNRQDEFSWNYPNYFKKYIDAKKDS